MRRKNGFDDGMDNAGGIVIVSADYNAGQDQGHAAANLPAPNYPEARDNNNHSSIVIIHLSKHSALLGAIRLGSYFTSSTSDCRSLSLVCSSIRLFSVFITVQVNWDL
ncbi:hypothetical protein J6590_006113 [Homalodisca vitripennis]|nr:hypothetical protein J6590_006113 [Homalodisca vitripennis]